MEQVKRLILIVLFAAILAAVINAQNVCEPDEKYVLKYLCTNESYGGLTPLAAFSEEATDVTHMCCHNDDVIVPLGPTGTVLQQSDCGSWSAINQTQSLELDAALYGEFPWTIALIRNRQLLGGGSLIHPKVVMTAAHKIWKITKESLLVRAGEYDATSRQEAYPQQDRQVVEIIIHPAYNPSPKKNNVALLVLNETVNLNAAVQTICLPEQNKNFDGQRCFASGWGKNPQINQHTGVLKKVELPIVPSDSCLERMKSLKQINPHFQMGPSLICAGGETAGVDTCSGDGGSPLVCPIEGTKRYQQVGIVGWGFGCGEQGLPAFYANVPNFREWIDQQMQQLNLSSSSYEYL